MIVKASESQTLRVGNKAVGGVLFKLVALAAANNTDIDSSKFDGSKVNVKVVVYRGGKPYQIVATTLDKVHAISSFFDGDFGQLNIGSQSATSIELIAKDTSVKEKMLLAFRLDFEGVIDLQKSDRLEVEVTFGSAALNSDLDSANTHIEVNPIEKEGVEVGTPYIHVKAISDAEQQFQHSLGDGVTEVLFFNTDGTGVLDADAVITNFTLSADGYNQRDNYVEMLAKRASQFENFAEAENRDQTFCLYKGKPLKGANIDITFEDTNVNGGKCYLIWRSYYSDARLAQVAHYRAQKAAAAEQFGFGIISASQKAAIDKQADQALKDLAV